MEIRAKDVLMDSIGGILKYTWNENMNGTTFRSEMKEDGWKEGVSDNEWHKYQSFDMSGYGNANYHNMEILSKFKDYMVPKKVEDRVQGSEHRNSNFIFPAFWKGGCSLLKVDGVREDIKILEGYDWYSGGMTTDEVIFDIITNQNPTILKDMQEELDEKNKEKNKFILTLSGEDKKIFKDTSNKAPMNKVIRLFQRNQKFVSVLKQLYDNKCQICGFTFKKDDGENYSEIHHVIALGDEGSDDIKNMIVVCPNCHRKLHYAKNKKYDIKYKEEHYKIVNGEKNGN